MASNTWVVKRPPGTRRTCISIVSRSSGAVAKENARRAPSSSTMLKYCPARNGMRAPSGSLRCTIITSSATRRMEATVTSSVWITASFSAPASSYSTSTSLTGVHTHSSARPSMRSSSVSSDFW